MAKRNQVTVDLKIAADAQLKDSQSFVKQIEKLTNNFDFGAKINSQFEKAKDRLTSLGKILDSTPLSNTTFNMGHRWELFYYFYNKYGTDEVAITDVEEFFEGYLKSRNNVDWYKGGDVSNIQLKYGDASITSFNSIVTALEKIDYALNAVELSHGQIVQELYNLKFELD